MSTPMTAAVFGTDEDPVALRPVWASLPLSITEAAAPAQLVAVDGRTADWVADLAAALDSGAAGILLRAPSPGQDPDDIAALAVRAASRSIPVLVESAWATDPAVDAHRDSIAGELPSMALIDVLSTIGAVDPQRPTLPAVALDQLHLLRAIGVEPEQVQLSRWSPNSFTIVASRGPTRLVLSAVIGNCGPSKARVSARGPGSESSLLVFGSSNARPAEAERTDAAGTVRLPSLYESASRAAWRRLHAAAASGAVVDQLTGLAADLRRLATIGPLS